VTEEQKHTPRKESSTEYTVGLIGRMFALAIFALFCTGLAGVGVAVLLLARMGDAVAHGAVTEPGWSLLAAATAFGAAGFLLTRLLELLTRRES
jgi:hypothetical protein